MAVEAGLGIVPVYIFHCEQRKPAPTSYSHLCFEGSVSRTAERATGLTRMDIAAAIFLAAFLVIFGICPPTWL